MDNSTKNTHFLRKTCSPLTKPSIHNKSYLYTNKVTQLSIHYNYTVEPLYTDTINWDQQTCPFNRDILR